MDLNRALEEIWAYIGRVNKYLAENETWIMAKDANRRARLARVLLQAAAAIRGASYLAFPVMPRSVDKVWTFLNEPRRPVEVRWEDLDFGGFGPGRKVGAPQALFPRVALKDFLDEEAGRPAVAPAQGPEPDTKGDNGMDQISYDEFRKMDLRVAQIIEAERVPGATKILKLKIDIGTEQPTRLLCRSGEDCAWFE